jgi:hypothetical protein
VDIALKVASDFFEDHQNRYFSLFFNFPLSNYSRGSLKIKTDQVACAFRNFFSSSFSFSLLSTMAITSRFADIAQKSAVLVLAGTTGK